MCSAIFLLHQFCCFQRNHLIYRNGQGGCVWTLRTTYSKGCRSLNFFQEYIKTVSSHDLYVISRFHDLLLRPLTGCTQEKCNAAACWLITAAAWMRRLPLVLLKSSGLTLRLQKGPPLIGLVVQYLTSSL